MAALAVRLSSRGWAIGGGRFARAWRCQPAVNRSAKALDGPCIHGRPLGGVGAVCSLSGEADNPRQRSQVALMIIGNEILSGSIQDSNTQWLAKSLYNRGVDLVRVEMLPDDIEDIVATVHRLKARVGEHGAIITSGGIGPTHDDVTYEAIAKATGTTLALHEPTVKKMRDHYSGLGKELNEARLRMATLPVGAEVLVTEGMWVPLVNIDEVYILPGIPRLFQGMLGAHLERFRGVQMHSAAVYTHQGEGEIAELLGDIAKRFPSVNIGSYPNVTVDKDVFTTKLNFESRDEEAMRAAVEEAKAVINCFTDI
eukprot:jgi/Tetstr1/430981/TSEL_020736.t1